MTTRCPFCGESTLGDCYCYLEHVYDFDFGYPEFKAYFLENKNKEKKE